MSLAPRIKWNVNEASIARIAKSYKNRSLKDVKEAIGFAAKAGAKGTLDFKIVGTPTGAATPTGSAWHYFANLVRGNNYGARVDTGRMASSVGSSEARGSRGVYGATYGLPLDGPKYFFQQEEGFTFETWSGRRRKVPGMADKRYKAQQKIDKAISSELRKRMVSRGFLSTASKGRDERILAKMEAGMSFADAWSAEYPGSEMYGDFMRQKEMRALELRSIGELRLEAFLKNLSNMEGQAKALKYLGRLRGSRD